MQIGKDQAAIVAAAFRQLGQLTPAVAHIHALQLQPHQQRAGVREIAVIVGLFVADLLIVELKRVGIFALVQVQQRLVPPDMEPEVVAVVPGIGVAFDQGSIPQSGRWVMS